MRSVKKFKTKSAIAKSMGQSWKEVREKAGLTQLQVAEALGYLNGQFISNVESGRCRFPSRQLPKIQKLYGLKTNDILALVLREEEYVLRAVLGKSS